MNALMTGQAETVFSQKHFPRSLLNSVDRFYHTFYPDTCSAGAREWTAVLGDSYLDGSGPEFLEGLDDYGIVPKLKKKTGRDYRIFARSGFGSIASARELVLCLRLAQKSPFLPDLKKPGRILFGFYEGNDLQNNLETLRDRPGHEPLDKWVQEKIFSPSPFRTRRTWFPLFTLAAGCLDGIQFPVLGSSPPRGVSPPPPVSRIRFDDRVMEVSGEIQSAPADISQPEDLTDGLEIAKLSLLTIRQEFSPKEMAVLYFPSVMTTYAWEGPVRVARYIGSGPLSANAEKNQEQSKRVRSSLRDFARQHGLTWIDATETLQKLGRQRLLHGSEDFGHLNRAGTEAVAQVLYEEGW